MKSLFLASSAVVLAGLLVLQAQSPPQTGPATEKRFPPLKLPAGFKATLFACDPLIEYPSVIAAGPRPGKIFVAVDFMTGLGSDGKVKSEIRLVEDTDGDGYADRASVVAEGFNSIQGLAYHEGTLVVMHAPFLTALRDGQRTDLLSGLGLNPENNPSRLHCANGVVVGHDGWLYLALGDNGVNVLRPEGDRLIHNGGAILRCRPDGHDLHVFSTGLRNIYDIALDAELNVFTRDNENDGGTYMVRVCHSFFGADHGYPYDYEERPDHALKPIGDFGLGSSAGGLCYLETHFPPEYRGNLFFCEWGRAVVRYPLARQGAGFAPVKEIEFASSDPKDTYPFKPTDVVVQQDGTLMVADYADGQRPKRGRGRIYHIAHVGKKAGMRPTSGLDSESYHARGLAQAALTVPSIQKLLSDKATGLGSKARMHLVWALARSEGAKAMEKLLEFAQSDPYTAVRVQAIRAVADLADPMLVKHKLDAARGDARLAARLADLAKGQPAQVRLEVTIALGRLRYAEAPAWLKDNLAGADPALEHAAMQTLRRADNWPAVLKLLDEPSASIPRRIAVRAVADCYEPVVVAELLRRVACAPDQSRRRECAELLTRVYKKPGPWKYWGYRPGPRPANTEAWEQTAAIEKALDRWLADSSHTGRMLILQRMQREKVPVRLATLTNWLKEESQPEAIAAILGALNAYPFAEVRTEYDAVVSNPSQTSANRLTALDALLKGPGVDAPATLAQYAGSLEDGNVLADVLRRLGSYPKYENGAPTIAPRLKSTDARVRAAALEALGELEAPLGRDAVLPFLTDPDVGVRRAAAGAAGKLGVKQATDLLLKLLADPEVRPASMDSLRRLGEKRVVPFAVASLKERALERIALQCLAELGGPEQLAAVLEFARRTPSVDGVALVVHALSAWQEGATPVQRAALLRAISEVQGTTGILVRWQIGPPTNPNDIRALIDRFAQPGHAPDSPWKVQLALDAEGRLPLEHKEIAGKPWRLALADVEVSADTPVEFLGSSNGALEVFLNGTSMHRRAKAAKSQIDSERFSATLRKGPNRVLVLIGDSEPLEFQLRFRRKSSKLEHEKLAQAALSRPGNADRGRRVFLDMEKSQCLKCHQIGNQGERIGPELTGVGSRFSRIHIIESILEPSRTIAPSFGTYVVILKSGKLLSGVKLADTPDTLTLADNQGQKHVLARKDIDEQQPSPLSTMPEGLEQRLTQDEFVDLIAFLVSQKGSRGP